MNILSLLQRAGKYLFEPTRRLLDTGFGPKLNPMNYLGALTIYFFWIVVVSGIWLFIFFKTSVVGAYESVEYLTHDQWYLGGVMRSLHRYASDAAVITISLHMIKEFVYDRHRGMRWFSWVTGVPLIWLVIPLGITGYWLVWDQLAWYVALTSAELLDWLPIFSESMARNFLSSDALSNRFFTLMAFMHLIGLPLFLVFGIWLHVLRINGPRINPPRLLMAASLLAMTALSLVFPALSQGEVDMTTVPGSLGLDWYYLVVYPLLKYWSPGWVWGLLTGTSLLLVMAPWLPPLKAKSLAVVDLDNCNGCSRCYDDCPFGAITMMPRSDGKAYETEAVVDPASCMTCGLCTGSCPTATPFRRHSALSPGIDIPDLSAAALRETLLNVSEGLSGARRILVFTCQGDIKPRKMKAALNNTQTATVDIICAGQLPPSYVDFILSRNLADGIVMAGCSGGDCQYRFGAEWASLRMARERDPHLRARVDSRRLALRWQLPWSEASNVAEVVDRLRESLPIESDEISSHPAPVRRLGFSKVAIISIFLVLFAVVVGVLSTWPRFQLIDDGMSMVSLSFSHAGNRIRECRRLTQEELNALPPNMRKLDDCARERLPLRVVFKSGDNILYEAVRRPTGLWKDGSANVYQRFELKAGTRRLFIGMNESGLPGPFDYTLEKEVTLEAGAHLVVEFDETQQTFIFKQE